MTQDRSEDPVDLLLTALSGEPEVENLSIEEIESMPLDVVTARLNELGVDDEWLEEQVSELEARYGRNGPIEFLLSAIGNEPTAEEIERMPLEQIHQALNKVGVNYRAGTERLVEDYATAPPKDRRQRSSWNFGHMFPRHSGFWLAIAAGMFMTVGAGRIFYGLQHEPGSSDNDGMNVGITALKAGNVATAKGFRIDGLDESDCSATLPLQHSQSAHQSAKNAEGQIRWAVAKGETIQHCDR